MYYRNMLNACLAVMLLVSVSQAESDFSEKLKSDYGVLSENLMNHSCEKTTISNFVYQKDVATFTFEEGDLYLLRYVDDRPTTAIFMGKGSARINVPSHMERQSLLAVSGDSLVEQEFETCFIRMGDDFDLKIKEKFATETTEMKWKQFNVGAKKPQGEMFFRPIIHHTYDNYFQLLRSIYERRSDGYFWIDFNRYVFMFDPNRPEEVEVAYEYQGGDIVATDGAVFQRQERGVYDDAQMSDINYPTTILDRQAEIEMSGLDGKFLKGAQTTIQVLVNADSLKFVTLFLHHNLKTDSIYYDGQPSDYHRRKDFAAIGVALPQYRYRGDTLSFTLWYHGKQFDHAMPYVENPQVSPHMFTFITPKDYNYFMPGIGASEKYNGRRQRFEVSPQNPYREFIYQCYASGLDTVTIASEVGVPLNFLVWELMDKKYSDCFIPLETYEETTIEAFNYMASQFGPPMGAFSVYVSPAGTYSMPGVLCVPQIACVTEGSMHALGGFHAVAGRQVARQWFGSLMRPATDREVWLTDAAPEYAGVLFLQSALGSVGYSHLLHRRDSVYRVDDLKRDRPLAVGSRAKQEIRSNKGLWVLHMLRLLMYDVKTHTDQAFLKFMHELALITSMKSYTNDDIVKLAEKHYGEPLDWFFKHWLYETGFPDYHVEYEITSRDDGYYVEGDVVTRDVDASFRMPVIMRVVAGEQGSIFVRESIDGLHDTFELGPYDIEPTELVFNEFYSVLCKQKVKKK